MLPSMSKDNKIMVRLSEEQGELLDKWRGSTPAATYIKDILFNGDTQAAIHEHKQELLDIFEYIDRLYGLNAFLDTLSSKSSRTDTLKQANFLVQLVTGTGRGGGNDEPIVRYKGWWVLPDPDGGTTGWWSDEHMKVIKVITDGKQQVVLTADDPEFANF